SARGRERRRRYHVPRLQGRDRVSGHERRLLGMSVLDRNAAPWHRESVAPLRARRHRGPAVRLVKSNSATQLNLFEPEPGLPGGFRYCSELLSEAEERALVAEIERLPFREIEFHIFYGRTR